MANLAPVSGIIQCFECGAPLMEVEPEGWWAGELAEMQQHVEEVETERDTAVTQAFYDRGRARRYKRRAEEAKKEALGRAREENNKITDKLCAMVDVINTMDSLINRAGKPTADELLQLNHKRRKGGLRPL